MYEVERFSNDTLIIQRNGADVINVTEAAMGEGVELPETEREAIFDAISAALARLNESLK